MDNNEGEDVGDDAGNEDDDGDYDEALLVYRPDRDDAAAGGDGDGGDAGGDGDVLHAEVAQPHLVEQDELRFALAVASLGASYCMSNNCDVSRDGVSR